MERPSQLAKCPPLGFCPAPLFEIAHAQTPSQPVVYFGNRLVIFRNPEVAHPASEVFGELLVPIAQEGRGIKPPRPLAFALTFSYQIQEIINGKAGLFEDMGERKSLDG